MTAVILDSSDHYIRQKVVLGEEGLTRIRDKACKVRGGVFGLTIGGIEHTTFWTWTLRGYFMSNMCR